MKNILIIAALLSGIVSGVAQNVVQAEYFIDTDAGVGNNTLVSLTNPQPDGNYNFRINLTGVSSGFHKLYIRTKDGDNNWTITIRRNIEVVIASPYVVSGAEYFFNTDPGAGSATPVKFNPPAADSSFSFKIPISSIPAGAHTLYLRARDSVNNNWSITQWQKDSVVTSVQSGKWSQPATWSNNKVPDGNTVVLLYHNVDVDIVDAVCKSLTPYGNSVNCNVEAGKALKITGRK